MPENLDGDTQVALVRTLGAKNYLSNFDVLMLFGKTYLS